MSKIYNKIQEDKPMSKTLFNAAYLRRYQVCADYVNNQTEDNWEKLRQGVMTPAEQAAPELLAACKAAFELYNLPQSIKDRLEPAIAKAEGAL